MSTYGDLPTEAVFSNRVTITVGGNTYAMGIGVRLDNVGNELIRQGIIGTDVTPMGTGPYNGTISIDTLYCTDGDFMDITQPNATTGMIPASTITLTLKDSQGSPTTTTATIYAHLNKISVESREGNFVRHGVTGEVTNATARAGIA